MGEPKPTEPIKLDVALPESAWVGPLQRYRDLVCVNSEVPEAWHWAAAVTVIGQLFGRRVYTRYATRLYLNFFFLLIGKTGTRKSTAISQALDLRADSPGGDQVAELHGAASGEGILKRLSTAPDGRLIIVEHELAGLIRKARNQSSGQMMETLCKVYDCPRKMDNGTKTDPISVDQPIGSLLCAATPESLEECLSDVDVYGGFLNRIIPVVGAKRAPQPWPPTPDEVAWSALVAEVDTVTNYYQRPTYLEMRDPAARERWEQFYTTFAAEQDVASDGVIALRQRMHTHVFRLSLLFAAMGGAESITDEDLERALDVGAYINDAVIGGMSDVAHGREIMIDRKIEQALWDRPLCRRDLQQRISGRVKGSELTKSLRTLLELERVIEVQETGELAWANAPYMKRRA